MKKIIVILTAVVLLATACSKKTDKLYLQAAQQAVNNFSQAVDAWDARIAAYEADHALIRDTTWAQESLGVLGGLQTAASAFRNLPEASSNLESLNTLLLSAADETDRYVDTVTTAINTLDENLIETAQSQRATIGNAFNNAQNELSRFLGSK